MTLATTTQAVQTTTNRPVAPPAAAATTLTPLDVELALQKALRRNPGGGGGVGGGEGPPTHARAASGPPQLAQGQHVAAPAGDVELMGQLPQIFTGDRTKSDDFIEELKAYLRVNRDVAGFNSPIKKVALALTLIKGPQVAGWTRDVGNRLDQLDPLTQNLPAIWDRFLEEFFRQFRDTQRANRARIGLGKLSMKSGEIDQYISKFENLARQAGYTAGDEATSTIFLKGLPEDILVDIFKPPRVTTYKDIKERAILCAEARITIVNLLKDRNRNQGNRPQQSNRGFRGGGFQNFQSSNNRQDNRSSFQGVLPPPPRNNNLINSSNAPRWMNNTVVPMDLGRARDQTWRGRGGGNRSFGRLAQLNGGKNTSCFSCGREGHFARDCQFPRHDRNNPYATANLIDWGEDEYPGKY